MKNNKFLYNIMLSSGILLSMLTMVANISNSSDSTIPMSSDHVIDFAASIQTLPGIPQLLQETTQQAGVAPKAQEIVQEVTKLIKDYILSLVENNDAFTQKVIPEFRIPSQGVDGVTTKFMVNQELIDSIVDEAREVVQRKLGAHRGTKGIDVCSMVESMVHATAEKLCKVCPRFTRYYFGEGKRGYNWQRNFRNAIFKDLTSKNIYPCAIPQYPY